MSPKEEIKPTSETSAASLDEGEEQTTVKKGKKPFLEPTLSVSLNVLDATAFFQASAALDIADT
jgi:hypothetical protein